MDLKHFLPIQTWFRRAVLPGFVFMLVYCQYAHAQPQSINDILPLLMDNNATIRREAVLTLSMRGPQATAKERKAIVEALAPLLADEDEYLRQNTAFALMNLVPESASAIPALLEHLGHESSLVRRPCATALGAIVPANKSLAPETIRTVVSALTGLLADEDPLLRHDAALALHDFGPDAQTALPALLGLVQDDSDTARQGALAALAGICMFPETWPSIPSPETPDVFLASSLALALADQNATIRLQAAETMTALFESTASHWSPGSLNILSQALSTALADDLDNLRLKSCEALIFLGRELLHQARTPRVAAKNTPQANATLPPPTVPYYQTIDALLDHLGDPNSFVRWRAAQALDVLCGDYSAMPSRPCAGAGPCQGSPANDIVQALTGLLQDKNLLVKQAAAQALGHGMAPRRDDSGPLDTDQPSPGWDQQATNATREAVLSRLKSLLADEAGIVRETSAWALAVIEPEQERDLPPELLGRLTDLREELNPKEY